LFFDRKKIRDSVCSNRFIVGKKNIAVVKFQVFYDRKEIVIDGETMKIMLLTKEILELYPKNENRSALFLKRSKDGKTSMSAP